MLKIITFGVFLALMFYNASVALENKYEVNGDAYDYLHLGLSLAKSGKFGHFKISRDELIEDFKENNIEHKEYEFRSQTAFRPPVWPLIIAGIFLVFGYSLTILVIFKFLLHVTGVYIFYKTLRLLKIRELMILIGTLFYAISPAWQLYSRFFLSEPLTLFLITLWVYLLIKHLKTGLTWWHQAFITGVIVLCHPYFLFLPFSIYLILYINSQISLRIFFLSSAVCAAIISSWVIRNSIVLNTDKVVLTTSSGAVMAKGWNSKVVNEHTNTKGDLADETLVLKDYSFGENRPSNEVDRMNLYKDATINFISSNPKMIVPIIGRKIRSAFNPFPETSRPGILETGRVIFQFLALIALLYIIIISRDNLMNSLALGLVLSTIVITIFTYSGFRFRMPQSGLEIMFMVFSLDRLLAKLVVRSHSYQ